jgi:ribosomal-protein-alanine N-acetyltransferase
MADLHATAFAPERGWSAQEFSDLLAQPHCHAYIAAGGFALARILAGETELLTLAVSPDMRRRGRASALLAQWITAAAPLADTAFLEVAADNTAARALYARHAFAACGRRKGYYARPGGTAVDALMMTRPLTAPLTRG